MDNILLQVAMEYHVNCELYDRSICQTRNERGVAIPVSNWEMGMINKNASNERMKAHRSAAARISDHITMPDVDKAIQHAAQFESEIMRLVETHKNIEHDAMELR